MAEAPFEIQRRHVLAGLDEAPAEAFEPTHTAAFQMRRAEDVARHVLRLDPAVSVQRGKVLGFDVSQAINTAWGQDTLLTAAPRASLRLGPDEWLLIGKPTAAADEAGLKIVDVSHRNVAIEVRGGNVRDVLNTGIALDLDEAVFPVGTATRTVLPRPRSCWCIAVMRRGTASSGLNAGDRSGAISLPISHSLRDCSGFHRHSARPSQRRPAQHKTA